MLRSHDTTMSPVNLGRCTFFSHPQDFSSFWIPNYVEKDPHFTAHTVPIIKHQIWGRDRIYKTRWVWWKLSMIFLFCSVCFTQNLRIRSGVAAGLFPRIIDCGAMLILITVIIGLWRGQSRMTVRELFELFVFVWIALVLCANIAHCLDILALLVLHILFRWSIKVERCADGLWFNGTHLVRNPHH